VTPQYYFQLEDEQPTVDKLSEWASTSISKQETKWGLRAYHTLQRTNGTALVYFDDFDNEKY